MQSTHLLVARFSKDGQRLLCGNRQCRHSGLAHLKEEFGIQTWYLAKGMDLRRDGTFALTKRPHARTSEGFDTREAIRKMKCAENQVGVMGHTRSLKLIPLPSSGMSPERRAYLHPEGPEQMISISALEKQPITVRCPRCHNCSVITRDLFSGHASPESPLAEVFKTVILAMKKVPD